MVVHRLQVSLLILSMVLAVLLFGTWNFIFAFATLGSLTCFITLGIFDIIRDRGKRESVKRP